MYSHTDVWPGVISNFDGFYSVCCDNFTPRVLQKPKLTTK
jgi:hypothetical protein